MPHSVTFDERQIDPRADLDLDLDRKTGDTSVRGHGDTPHGQRHGIAGTHTNGDFASGMRNLSLPRVVGDFASGMRTLARAATPGDFATGMRTMPRVTTLGDFATGMRIGSAPVVMNAFASPVTELSMPPEVMVA